MKRLKILNSHIAHACFLEDCSSETLWLASKHCPARTPYRFGPTVAILKWGNHFVWVAEVAHRRFEVWSIPSEFIRATEQEAMAEHLAT